jgi:hypothetical protein
VATDSRDYEAELGSGRRDLGLASAGPFPRLPTYFDLWDVDECAFQLRMAPGTLRNLGKKGPPKVKLGGAVYYRPETVAAWLASVEEK